MSGEINLPIYMDYAYTTPVDPRVAKQKINIHEQIIKKSIKLNRINTIK